jgi:hypothetical protein
MGGYVQIGRGLARVWEVTSGAGMQYMRTAGGRSRMWGVFWLTAAQIVSWGTPANEEDLVPYNPKDHTPLIIPHFQQRRTIPPEVELSKRPKLVRDREIFVNETDSERTRADKVDHSSKVRFSGEPWVLRETGWLGNQGFFDGAEVGDGDLGRLGASC